MSQTNSQTKCKWCTYGHERDSDFCSAACKAKWDRRFNAAKIKFASSHRRGGGWWSR